MTDETRLEGPDSVTAAVALLEGFEAPAGAWETELLPTRIGEYEPAWLDDQCLAGRVAWARLTPAVAKVRSPDLGRESPSQTRSAERAHAVRKRAVAPVRTTPVFLLARRHLPFWTACPARRKTYNPALAPRPCLPACTPTAPHSSRNLVEATHLLRPQVEDALAELVALGMVNSDSFGGLRALLVPADRRKPFGGATRRRQVLNFSMDDAGRWALARRPAANANDAQAPAAIEYVARALLRRYGVVFWRLLAREADWLPPWRDLLRVYRRLEARGDVRGRRFVAGFSGEQYARGHRQAARGATPTGPG